MMAFLKWYGVIILSLNTFIALYGYGKQEKIANSIIAIVFFLPIIIYLILS